MIKLVSPSGWDWDRPVAVPLKVSSRGLVGHDRREFLKSASHEFLPHVDRLRDELRKHAGDYEPVHMIALGADERYSANRNGDTFDAATCRSRHGSFVKNARHYRNHANKPSSPHYGQVKLSAYNEAMWRTELLNFLFKTKEAAERHGGYVADRELEKLARGDDLDVSMACRVPLDVCSCCRNEARTREDYCTADRCPGGGCADNLARVVKVGGDLHHLRVFNPGAEFFDISTVHRRADRIAQGARADYLDKAASDGGFTGVDSAKAAAALGVSAPLALLDGAADPEAALVKLAHGLAAVERRPRDAAALLAFAPGLRPPVDLSGLDGLPWEKAAGHLAALADRGCVLPPAEFARFTKTGAAGPLPRLHATLLASGRAEAAAASRWARLPDPTPAAREWAARHKAAYALDADSVERRAAEASLRGLAAGPAAGAPGAALPPGAEAYAAYQLAALKRAADAGLPLFLTAVFCAHQNAVL